MHGDSVLQQLDDAIARYPQRRELLRLYADRAIERHGLSLFAAYRLAIAAWRWHHLPAVMARWAAALRDIVRRAALVDWMLRDHPLWPYVSLVGVALSGNAAPPRIIVGRVYDGSGAEPRPCLAVSVGALYLERRLAAIRDWRIEYERIARG